MLLIRFAEENEIPYRLTGKLVVAVSDAELPKLHALQERGTANGLQGLRLVGDAEAREIEPNVVARQALHVPESGIIDYREVTSALARRDHRRRRLAAPGPRRAGGPRLRARRHARDDRRQRRRVAPRSRAAAPARTASPGWPASTRASTGWFRSAARTPRSSRAAGI